MASLIPGSPLVSDEALAFPYTCSVLTLKPSGISRCLHYAFFSQFFHTLLVSIKTHQRKLKIYFTNQKIRLPSRSKFYVLMQHYCSFMGMLLYVWSSLNFSSENSCSLLKHIASSCCCWPTQIFIILLFGTKWPFFIASLQIRKRFDTNSAVMIHIYIYIYECIS